MNTPTPRTDEAVYQIIGPGTTALNAEEWQERFSKLANFARTLERELAEARKQRDDYIAESTAANDYIRKFGVLLDANGDDTPEVRIAEMKRELSEANEQLAERTNVPFIRRQKAKLAAVTKERDDIEICNKIMSSDFLRIADKLQIPWKDRGTRSIVVKVEELFDQFCVVTKERDQLRAENRSRLESARSEHDKLRADLPPGLKPCACGGTGEMKVFGGKVTECPFCAEKKGQQK